MPPPVVFVNRANASAITNGATWETAFRAIQEGIDACHALGGGEVWIAGGKYGELRTNGGAVVLRSGVHVYGGFAGTESLRAERNWTLHATTIDGFSSNGGAPATRVVQGADDATLDGFVIQGGRGAYGGGLRNDGVSPLIRHCVFRNNRATTLGGGMYNADGAAPRIHNSIFYNNHCDTHGGALANDSASPSLVGCTVSENRAAFRGAGIYNNVASFPTCVNCIFWNNTPEDVGSTGTSHITIQYSTIGVTTPGIGNVFLNPLFRNPSIGNFTLRPGSPAIDRGRDTSGAEFGNVTHDLQGNLRGYDGDGLGLSTADGSDFDMGAHEFTGEDATVYHSADTNADFAIILTELLRVVQFYNSGAYHCVFGTEDGYAPGPGACEAGLPHNSDYAPQDFKISLVELLRLVQFYNAPGGYMADPETEDGYRPIFDFPQPTR